MILCRRAHYWFLAGFSSDPKWKGVFSVRVAFFMFRDPDLDWRASNNYLIANELPNRIPSYIFYPELRYRGIRVRPEGWKEDSREPILRVSASVVAADYPPLTDAETEALIAQLKSEGWQWDVREGGVGYVHVDDLEKIEGPPPHGAF